LSIEVISLKSTMQLCARGRSRRLVRQFAVNSSTEHPVSRPRRTQRCSDAPSVTVIRSILPIPCYPTLRYISRQQQPPYLAHFSLMQSTCLRTKPTPKHLTPTKMQDFAANESENRYSRGCSPVGSVPNDWHPGQVKLFVKSWASGLPWAGNPELLHTELKCGPLYPQSCCRSIRTGKHPVGLLRHRQDVPLFHLFEGRSSIHVPVCVRSLCFRPRERMTARLHSVAREPSRATDN
jgi:hypothetical protein